MRRAPAAYFAAAAAAATTAAATLLALAPTPAGAQYEPAGEDSKQARKRAEFDRAGGPPLSMQADPVFRGVGGASGRMTPLVVRVKNRGLATSADIEVQTVGGGSGMQRTYTRRVTLPGGGAVSRFLLYPSTDSYTYGGYGEAFRVVLRAGGRSLWEGVPLSGVGSNPQVGYIGDRVGALNFHAAERAWEKRAEKQPWRYRSSGSFHPFVACDAEPEDAPERAAGYAALDHLVLGEGAERLTEAQWRAIRGWVQSGGSLILLEGCRPGAAAEAAGVSPITGEASGFSLVDPATDRVRIGGLMLPTGPSTFTVTSRDLAPGARNLGPWVGEGGAKQTALAQRDVGAGTVLYVGFDPTHSTFRSWPDLNLLWTGLLKRAAPPVPADSLRQLAADLSDGVTADFRNGSDPHFATITADPGDGSDPFAVKMPHLRSVVFLFLGYFVLAIPVTFVVLKRTRRMNLAWITGPTLAVGVAGALYLFTFGLSRAPSSRRTAGVLVAAAGDADARFLGYTEIFLDKAGNYDVTVPGAERLELHPDSVEYGHYPGGTAIRSLESADDGKAVTEPRLPVANLSFRRLYHEQPVSLGGGIRATAKWNGNGTVSYSVHNGTRRTLHDVRLLVKDAASPNYQDWETALSFQITGPLAPGATSEGKGIGERYTFPLDNGSGQQYRPHADRLYQAVARGHNALVIAQTSGDDLGPSVGRYSGGDRSVLVVVPVPNPAPKGGR